MVPARIQQSIHPLRGIWLFACANQDGKGKTAERPQALAILLASLAMESASVENASVPLDMMARHVVTLCVGTVVHAQAMVRAIKHLVIAYALLDGLAKFAINL